MNRRSWLIDFFFVPEQTDQKVPPGINPNWHRMLERIFTIALRIGIPLLMISTFIHMKLGSFSANLVIIFAIELGGGILALTRGIPFKTRAIWMITFVYITGLMEISNFGNLTAGLLFFIASIIGAILAIGRKSGLYMLLASILTVFILGWAINQGNFIPAALRAGAVLPYTLTEGIRSSFFVFAGIASGIYFTVSTALDNLNHAWHLQVQATNLLQQERDLLEQRVEERTRDLRKVSEAVEHSGSSVLILDTDGRIEYANPQFARSSGFSSAETIGKFPAELFRDKSSGENHPVTEKWKEEMAKAGIWHGEFYNKSKDGRQYWNAATIAPIYDDKGSISNYVEIGEDVTEQKRLQEKLQKQKEYLAILHEITLDLLNRRSVDELLQAVIDSAVQLLDAPFCELMLEQDGKLVVQTASSNQKFIVGEKAGREEAGISWQAFDTRQPVTLDDYSTYPYRRDIYEESHLHAVADFPILVRDKCIGVLAWARSQPGYVFSEEQVWNGILFAQLVALVLDNTQLLSAAQHEIAERKQVETELRENQKFLADLIEYSATIVFAKDKEGRYELVNRKYEEVTGIPREAIIGHTDKEYFSEEIAAKYRASDLQVLGSGQALKMEDTIDKPEGQQHLFTIKFPLRADDGSFRGVCGITTDITERKHAEIQLANVNAQLRASIEETLLLQDDLRQQALHDVMTGLYNRRYMQDVFVREFSRAARENHSLCMIMMDMDGLKQFNDTYGHNIGDRAIQTLALCIKGMIRTEDVACRYGGDEFTVIMCKANPEDAIKRIEEWRSFLSNHPMPIDEKNSAPVKFTAGIACFPMHGSSVEEVTKRADLALYRAKESGRNCTVMFE